MIDFADLSQSTLQTYEELLIAYLNALYPELDTSPGTVINEMVIRPAAVLYTQQEADLETLRQQFSLSLLAASSSPSLALAENVASNYRLTRKTGGVASGSLAIYTNQVGNVYIRNGSTFTVGGIILTVDKTYIGVFDSTGYTDTAQVAYREMIKVSATSYAFTIPVYTTTSTTTTITEGTTVTPTQGQSVITTIKVASAITGGTADETVQDLVARASTGVTAAVPSGNVHLNSLFKNYTGVNILSQVSFGIGDTECLRDRNNVFLASTGGRVDSYCRTSQLPASTEILKTASITSTANIWAVDIDKDSAPGFYYVSKIAHDVNPYTITDPDLITHVFRGVSETDGPYVYDGTSARYSQYQSATIYFYFPGLTGTTADFNITLYGLPSIDTLQEYVNRRDIKNEVQDVLIKAPAPNFIGVSLTVNYAPGVLDVTAEDIQTVIASTINTTSIGREYILASDIVEALHTAYPDLKVDFPMTITSTAYLPDGTVRKATTLDGHMDAYVDETQGITARNTAFFCKNADISVTFKESQALA